MIFIFNLYPQEEVLEVDMWEVLSDVRFETKKDEFSGMVVEVPVFGEDIKALNGKKIIIKGYLLPETGYKTHKEFILSALPYNLCYFCGKAGPETVMQVYAKDAVKYSNKMIELEGVLKLNFIDPYDLPYHLEDARLID